MKAEIVTFPNSQTNLISNPVSTDKLTAYYGGCHRGPEDRLQNITAYVFNFPKPMLKKIELGCCCKCV